MSSEGSRDKVEVLLSHLVVVSTSALSTLAGQLAKQAKQKLFRQQGGVTVYAKGSRQIRHSHSRSNLIASSELYIKFLCDPDFADGEGDKVGQGGEVVQQGGWVGEATVVGTAAPSMERFPVGANVAGAHSSSLWPAFLPSAMQELGAIIVSGLTTRINASMVN